eukprot:7147827-Pyramimonas_sp.AAC.1
MSGDFLRGRDQPDLVGGHLRNKDLLNDLLEGLSRSWEFFHDVPGGPDRINPEVVNVSIERDPLGGLQLVEATQGKDPDHSGSKTAPRYDSDSR